MLNDIRMGGLAQTVPAQVAFYIYGGYVSVFQCFSI